MASYSLVAVYSAMAVYTLSFLLFTLDLAKSSSAKPVRVLATVGGDSQAVTEPEAQQPAISMSVLQRIARGLLSVGLACPLCRHTPERNCGGECAVVKHV
jgi:hypothetical protein